MNVKKGKGYIQGKINVYLLGYWTSRLITPLIQTLYAYWIFLNTFSRK